jgi:hypothetical protein
VPVVVCGQSSFREMQATPDESAYRRRFNTDPLTPV